jgi:mono/diheme cytochrome c family protein
MGGSAERGLDVFVRACASCHGERGEGTSLAGRSGGDISDPAFLALSSDQVLRRYIITGRQDLGMPGYGPVAGRSAAFKPLTAEQVSDVVALLASWRQGEGKK